MSNWSSISSNDGIAEDRIVERGISVGWEIINASLESILKETFYTPR